MKVDTAVGGLLFTIVTARLLQKGIISILVWFLIAIAIAYHGMRMSLTISVAIGIIALYGLSVLTQRTFEGFEDEVPEEEKKEENPKTPNPAPPKTDDPHVDIGTTILHAYRNLSPEQIGGMRRDTRELLELQKELMGSLTEMKPAIEQGAELLKTFSTFFGDANAQ
jgi:hypothetical protein